MKRMHTACLLSMFLAVFILLMPINPIVAARAVYYHHLDIRVPATYTIISYLDGEKDSSTRLSVGDDDNEKILLNGVYLYKNGNELDRSKDAVKMNSNLSLDGGEYEYTGQDRNLRFTDNYTVFVECDIYVKIGDKLEEYKNQEYIAKLSELENLCSSKNSNSNSRGFDFSFEFSAFEYKVGSTTCYFEKEWAGDEFDNTGRADVTVNVLRGTDIVNTVTLTKESQWKNSITLPNGKYDESHKWTAYSYDFKEVNGEWSDSYYAAEKYKKSDADGKITYTFTNTYKNLTDVTLTKTWEDYNDIEGIRPEMVYFKLVYKSDGAAVEGIDLAELAVDTNDNTDSYTFYDVPKFDEEGNRIVYSAVETNSDGSAYTGEYARTVTVTDSSVNVVNSYNPKVSINFTKVWNDCSNGASSRPDSYFVGLYADNTLVSVKELAAGETAWTFEGDKYNNDGNLRNYTVKEVKNSDGEEFAENELLYGYYTASVADSEIREADFGYTITNTYIPKTDITVKKVWHDFGNKDGARPAKLYLSLYADGVIIDTAQLDSAEVDNEDGSLITDTQTYDYKNLDVYRNDGTPIVYTVKESADASGAEYVPVDGYNVRYSDDDGFTVTNMYEPKISVTVEKLWSDFNDDDEIRPVEIDFTLYGNSIPVGEHAFEISNATWKTVINDLPKYDEYGEAIEYTVSETDVEYYTTSNGEGAVDDNGNVDIQITNSYMPKVNITVEKEWTNIPAEAIDENIAVTYELYSKLSPTAEAETLIDSAVVTGVDGWSYTWSDQPKYSEGENEPLLYLVKEVLNESTRAAYAVSYSDDLDEADNFSYLVINNNIETVEITASKVWNDFNNEDGLRPESVTLQLLLAGEAFDAENAVLTEQTEWKHTWTLPKYVNGIQAEYTVREATEGETPQSADYTVSYSEDTLTVTNSHMPKVSKTVTKVWDDANNAKKTRPETVEIELFADGKATGMTCTLSADTAWAYSWDKLDKYNSEGKEIVYTVGEISIADGYNMTYSDDTFTVTNTYVPLVTKTVTVIWADENNKDGLRPEKLTVSLYANGEFTGKTAELNEDGNWSYSWTDLREFDDAGTLIVYSVKSADSEGYTVSYSADTFVITKLHVPEKTDRTVRIEWADRNNTDGVRPSSVTVQLFADGEKAGEPVTVNAASDWSYSWSELERYLEGREIVYTVQEIPVPDKYIAFYSADTFTITNTHNVNQDTGDNAALNTAMGTVILAAAVFIIMRKRKAHAE